MYARRKFRSLYFLSLILVLNACAGKRAKVVDVTVPQQTAPPTSAHPSLEPIPPPPAEPQKAAAVERARIGLVLGGAGVASFATVGLLKRFQQEGIKVDFIVANGWPAIFPLGYGFLKSVHDLEWFAMRLQEKDFYVAGLFDVSREYASHDKLSALIGNAFTQQSLDESKVPVIISAANTEPGDPEVYEKGDWRTPLLKTMSVPGIYRPYPQGTNTQWISSLQGIDVSEASHREADIIIGVAMYDDYFTFLKQGGKKSNGSDQLFRQLYLTQLKNTIGRELKLAQITGRIDLNKTPNDFTAKRMAVQVGYREGARIAKEIRRLVDEAN